MWCFGKEPSRTATCAPWKSTVLHVICVLVFVSFLLISLRLARAFVAPPSSEWEEQCSLTSAATWTS